ncbi:MAG TPA: hypothetical protein VJV03_19460, partial [Pyrinomonadaceae bacterium]|nr:hypothetical protein [Pyrinomonadaceae bacterium]
MELIYPPDITSIIIPVRTAQPQGASALTPTELDQSENDEQPTAPSRQDAHAKWVLTSAALDQLLYHFSPDREDAAALYETMRL